MPKTIARKPDQHKRAALFMQELLRQQKIGEIISNSEKNPEKILRLRRGEWIVLDGKIPAKIIEYDAERVMLRVARADHIIRTSWILGRFKYATQDGECHAQ